MYIKYYNFLKTYYCFNRVYDKYTFSHKIYNSNKNNNKKKNTEINSKKKIKVRKLVICWLQK